jgi:hypothetical protein
MLERDETLDWQAARIFQERRAWTSPGFSLRRTCRLDPSRGFDRLMMGSVSEKVVQHALCPVLVVPSASDA